MKVKCPRVGVVLIFALASRAVLGQTHIVPPPTPPLVTPRIPPCNVSAAPLDLEKIKKMQGVEGVVADADKSKATVLFDNADVLKVQSWGCYARGIDVRLWTETFAYDASALKLKAQKITDMLFDASRAQGIDQSIGAASFNYGNFPVRSVDGNGFIITITSVPLGGLNTFMKITYPDNGRQSQEIVPGITR